jgi:hypothetical protein
MIKPKYLLTFLILLSIVLLPSSNALMMGGIASTISDQRNQEVISTTTIAKSNDLLNQEARSPSAVSTILTTRRVFLPFVFKPTASYPSNTYFVAPTGSDSNPGTIDRPWRSIQKAASNLAPGDTLKILPGTYYEKFSPVNSGKENAYITYTADPGTVIIDGSGIYLNDSSSEGLVQIQGKSYIRLQNLTIRNSTVNCVSVLSYSGIRPSYIEITGLNIQNCSIAGILVKNSDQVLINNNSINHIEYSSGIGVWFSNYVTVDHNTITNAHYYHECQGAYNEALTISWVNHFEVMYNTLDNTEASPSGFCSNADKLGIDVKESSQNGSVYHNTISNMSAAGIYVDGWHAGANDTPTLNHINIYQNKVMDGGGIIVGCEQSDGVVEYVNIFNNLVLNSAFAGIQVRGAWGDGLRKNINIYNNTIYGASVEGGNGGAGIYVTTSHLGSNNGDSPVIIRNNISMFYFLSTGGGTLGQIVAATSQIASMITADHNLVYGPQKCSDTFPDCVEVGSRISAKPDSVYRNATIFDLHLLNYSPAINTGLNIGIVANDFDDISRPQPASGSADIGAYEYK